MLKGIKNRLGNLGGKAKVAAATGAITAASIVPAFAETTEDGLNLNFDVTEMFTWAQAILDAMMPVVYVSMGVGLGFLIVRALKAAFN